MLLTWAVTIFICAIVMSLATNVQADDRKIVCRNMAKYMQEARKIIFGSKAWERKQRLDALR